jgi:hypothetical protein
MSMTKAMTGTCRQNGADVEAHPSFDAIEIAATLRCVADLTRDAANHLKLLSEALRLLVRNAKPHLGTSSASLLAATIGVWNARQSARELKAAHEALSKEADRYAR